MSGIRSAAAGLDAFLDYFIPASIRVDPDTHRRARMFMLSHVFGPFLGNVIPLYLYLERQPLDYRFWTFTGSITAFWLYPIALKLTRRYSALAFISIENLLFCVLWACFSYGGIYSPFLPWLLITPLLAFFYLPSTGRSRNLVLLIMTTNVAVFSLLIISKVPLPQIDLDKLQAIGILSTISASIYVAMMAVYFARVFSQQQKFERELGELLATNETLESLTRAAQKASTAKSAFIASMSHELRTPLNAVIGYSDLLLEDAADHEDPSIVRDLQTIHDAGVYLLELVNDILDFSRIEAGKMPVNPSANNMLERLGETLRSLQDKLAERNYSLKTDLGASNLTVETDWAAFANALRHLILATAGEDDGGELEVRAEREPGERVTLKIIGPAAEADSRSMEELFDAFHDERDVSSTRYGGVGIGLALSRRFARLIGGDLTSSIPAAGHRQFSLTIPVNIHAEPVAA